MAEIAAQPTKILRGTWDQILRHWQEIPATSQVEVRVFGPTPFTDPSIALLESWLRGAPTDPEAIEAAEDDLRVFKYNMNLPRKVAGARLHYPEVE